MTKLNVAIADDNERILTLLDDLLKADEEINVVGTAKDGESAYDLIREKEPDVVLLDLVMPRIDGLSVMDKIKNDANIKKIPSFIVISGINNESVTEDAIGLGAAYYIMKPFDNAMILNRVKQIGGNRNSLSRERKSQVSIPSNTETKVRNLEHDVTNIIHEVGVPAHH